MRLRDPECYERLLAVGVLAALLALYFGRYVERQGHARRFTSNTRATQTRRELSCINLGLLALHDGSRYWGALLRCP